MVNHTDSQQILKSTQDGDMLLLFAIRLIRLTYKEQRSKKARTTDESCFHQHADMQPSLCLRFNQDMPRCHLA